MPLVSPRSEQSRDAWRITSRARSLRLSRTPSTPGGGLARSGSAHFPGRKRATREWMPTRSVDLDAAGLIPEMPTVGQHSHRVAQFLQHQRRANQ